LQAAGYTVVCSLSPKQAVDQFLQGDFDLILLCHPIPPEDRERLARLIREHTSRTPVISISPTLGQHDLFSDATIESDPRELVTGIRRVLRRNGEHVSGGDGHVA
jgi:CheY-like chemotaxis protein